MFEIFSLVFLIGPLLASVFAAAYAYKAYVIVKLERDIRIAREEAEKDERADS